MKSTTRARNTERQSGIAATELAVCLPVIVVLVFAAIESCTMIFVAQALHAAGYEGARVAINHNATTSQVVQRAQQILDGHGLAGTSVQCVPTDVSTAKSGDLVTIVVTASCDSNRLSPALFFGGRDIAIRTTMAKE